MLKETTGPFDGNLTHDCPITSPILYPLHRAGPATPFLVPTMYTITDFLLSFGHLLCR